jgi:hypothetical protein
MTNHPNRSRNPYNPAHYVVEVHMGFDVLHKDYGPDAVCAFRAIDRLMPRLNYDGGIAEIRLWHKGQMTAKREAGH